MAGRQNGLFYLSECVGTIVGKMRDKEGNEVVVTEARIFSKEHFAAPAV